MKTNVECFVEGYKWQPAECTRKEQRQLARVTEGKGEERRGEKARKQRFPGFFLYLCGEKLSSLQRQYSSPCLLNTWQLARR